MADGSRHSLYAVAESVYGETPASPALDLVRITGTTLGLDKDSLQSEEIRSDRQIADFRLGANQVNGDINFELSYGTFDDLLEAVLMSANWATDTPSVGTDQIKGGTLRRSFTMIRHFADISDKPYLIFRGVEINQMTLSIAANAMVTGTFSVIGQSQTAAADLTALGTPTYNPASTTSPVDSFTGTLNEGGTPIAVITEIQLTLSNGMEPKFVVGSKNSLKPSSGRSNVTGQITAYFEDAVMLEKFLNETESNIVFNMPDAAGNNVSFKIPRIKYTGGRPDVQGEGPITLSMPFQALLDATESTNFIIERTPV